MAFWFTLAVFAISTIASYLLRPRAPDDAPDPTGHGLDVPNINEGGAVPVLWGTAKLKGPLVAWYGCFHGANGIYYAAVWYAWCYGPLDELVSVQWDELEPTCIEYGGAAPIVFPLERSNPTWADRVTIYVSDNDLFGGAGGEGGVTGKWKLYWGTDDQTSDDDLSFFLEGRYHDTEMPGYRRLAYSVLGDVSRPPFAPWITVPFVIGNNAYLKPHSIVARRFPNNLGLATGHHRIGNDANPAEMIYEIITDASWGCHISASDLDLVALRAVGETLYEESFGLSMQVTDQTDASQVIRDILRHVDGIMFPDPTTGALTFKLIRDDYTPGDVPCLDDTSILELEEFWRPTLEETSNRVMLTYTDASENWTERVVAAEELANIRLRNGVYPQDLRFLGITNASLAQAVASRELKGVSYPFARATMVVNRQAWSMRPGQVFRLTWPAYGISEMVMRVVAIRLGSISDGKIRIDAVEDAFHTDWTTYSAPGPSGWLWPLQSSPPS